MLTKEQGETAISFTCYDAIVVMQMIEKLLKSGLVSGKELAHVAGLRIMLLNSVHVKTGVNLDTE